MYIVKYRERGSDEIRTRECKDLEEAIDFAEFVEAFDGELVEDE